MVIYTTNTPEVQKEIKKLLALAQCIQESRTLEDGTVLEGLLSFHENYPQISFDALRYDSSGDTILHCTARNGNALACKYLLQHFSPDCRNKDNKTPLHEAAQFGQTEVAKILLSAGAQVDALKKADWTPLMLACTKLGVNKGKDTIQERYHLVDLLLEKGASVNFQNKDGWHSLHLAVREGDLMLVQKLCKNGADVRGRTKNGNTCLHIAALHKHLDVFKDLISISDEILKWQSNHGNYPLHEAVLSKDLYTFTEISRLYLQKSFNLEDLWNKIGYNVMHLAAFIGATDIVKVCLDTHKFDLHKATNDQQNCLHLAAQNCKWAVFKVCLDLGLDETCKDKFGRTPCDYNKFVE